MTRGRARRYLLTKQGYYPGVVASMGYDVWDWSTLNKNTMFQDSTKLIPAKDQSDPVGCWVDYVKKTDATQLSTPNKPGLDLASLNGLPTLSFNGSDMLATGNISISTFAVWCVFRNSTAGTRMVYEQSVATGSNPGMFLTADINATISATRTVGTLQLSSKNYVSNWATDNTWRVTRNESAGTHATQKLAVNNSLVSLSTFSTQNKDVGIGTATNPLFIGARSGVAIPITGNIAHLCIVSPYPTDAIIAQMETYINGLWGVY